MLEQDDSSHRLGGGGACGVCSVEDEAGCLGEGRVCMRTRGD